MKNKYTVTNVQALAKELGYTVEVGTQNYLIRRQRVLMASPLTLRETYDWLESTRKPPSTEAIKPTGIGAGNPRINLSISYTDSDGSEIVLSSVLLGRLTDLSMRGVRLHNNCQPVLSDMLAELIDVANQKVRGADAEPT